MASSLSTGADGRAWSCGREAARALASRIGSRPVACEERDQDRYGQMVAVCRVRGEDVNAWMVAEGWAFAYRRYGNVAINYWRAGRGLCPKTDDS